jgi:hypothetical protein
MTFSFYRRPQGVSSLKTFTPSGLSANLATSTRRHRSAPFGDEEPEQSVRTNGQKALDRAEFIPGDWLFDGQPVLETPNPEACLIEVDVIAANPDRLADGQPMALHHQHQQVIADAVASPLGGLLATPFELVACVLSRRACFPSFRLTTSWDQPQTTQRGELQRAWWPDSAH